MRMCMPYPCHGQGLTQAPIGQNAFSTSACPSFFNMFDALNKLTAKHRMGGVQAGFGEQRTKAQVLLEHTSALRELKQKISEGPNFQPPSLIPLPRKAAAYAQPPAVERCSPILIKDLEVGCTHRGSVLRGKLITDAIKMRSVQSVLEDEAGDAVTVHMYNVPSLSDFTTTLTDLEQAQALFPQGQHLAVIEPFYKIMLDGTYGVRVDNPAEVVFLDEQGQQLHTAAYVDPAAARPAAAQTTWTPTDSGPVSKPKRPGKSKKGRKTRK